MALDGREVKWDFGTNCGVNSKNCKTGGAKSREPHTSRFDMSGQLYPVVSVCEVGNQKELSELGAGIRFLPNDKKDGYRIIGDDTVEEDGKYGSR